MAIDINVNCPNDKKLRPKTLIVNPYWSFKSTNKLSNHNQWLSWSEEDLKKLDISKYMSSKTHLLILMMSPTALATGKHLEVLKAWGYSPTTVGSFVFKKCFGSGNNRLNDSTMFFVLANHKGRDVDKTADHVIMNRHNFDDSDQIDDGILTSHDTRFELKNGLVDEQEMPYGPGMTFGPEGYKYFEQLGQAPFLNVFFRKRQSKSIPEDWYYWNPHKSYDLAETFKKG